MKLNCPNGTLEKKTDILLNTKFAFTFDTNKINALQYSNRGFEILINYLTCGGTISASKDSTSFVFNSTTQKDPKNPRCIWLVTSNSQTLSDLTLQINATLAKSTKAILKVYDSISLRDQDLHVALKFNNTESSYWGSINTAIIVYNYSDALKNNEKEFSVNITVKTIGKLCFLKKNL